MPISGLFHFRRVQQVCLHFEEGPQPPLQKVDQIERPELQLGRILLAFRSFGRSDRDVGRLSSSRDVLLLELDGVLGLKAKPDPERSGLPIQRRKQLLHVMHLAFLDLEPHIQLRQEL